MSSIVGVDGTKAAKVPKIKAVHPFRSKILVEIINGEEMIDTSLVLPDGLENEDIIHTATVPIRNLRWTIIFHHQ